MLSLMLPASYLLKVCQCVCVVLEISQLVQLGKIVAFNLQILAKPAINIFPSTLRKISIAQISQSDHQYNVAIYSTTVCGSDIHHEMVSIVSSLLCTSC